MFDPRGLKQLASEVFDKDPAGKHLLDTLADDCKNGVMGLRAKEWVPIPFYRAVLGPFAHDRAVRFEQLGDFSALGSDGMRILRRRLETFAPLEIHPRPQFPQGRVNRVLNDAHLAVTIEGILAEKYPGLDDIRFGQDQLLSLAGRAGTVVQAAVRDVFQRHAGEEVTNRAPVFVDPLAALSAIMGWIPIGMNTRELLVLTA